MQIEYRNSERRRTLIKYILGRINDSLARTGEVRIDFVNVNIEHVIPQRPSDDWNLTRDEINDYVNLLGNLTLLDRVINSSIGNSHIDEKITKLRSSVLPITQNLVITIEELNNVWDENSIRNRHAFLSEISFERVWDY